VDPEAVAEVIDADEGVPAAHGDHWELTLPAYEDDGRGLKLTVPLFLFFSGQRCIIGPRQLSGSQ
jgi:hypothetical protein